MKKRIIIYLTFYFEPDIGAGSFRNTSLVKELSNQCDKNVKIIVFSSFPNRYSSYNNDALEYEEFDNISLYRIKLPKHKNGFIDQIISFYYYWNFVFSKVKNINYEMVFASSSRLFTAFLGYRIAYKKSKPLYLDIRDIFVDTIIDVIKNKFLKFFLIPILKIIEYKTFNYSNHINLISPGFEVYFKKFKNVESFSFFTNGIDPIFTKSYCKDIKFNNNKSIKTILYAGNIGDGQGLENIIPKSANLLKEKYKFKVIGDGGTKNKLINAIKRNNVTNVEIIKPMSRVDLISEYNMADFLFIHLNDYDAFKKVLPSKVFELASFNKPILAGVNGYCKEFINQNINNSIVFYPGNETDLVKKLNSFVFDDKLTRCDFIKTYKRSLINKRMAESIIRFLN